MSTIFVSGIQGRVVASCSPVAANRARHQERKPVMGILADLKNEIETYPHEF
jgi:hypothetical protein